MPSTPIARKDSAEAADISVRDQPYSASNTLKNRPKENSSPMTVNCVRQAPATTR